MKFKSNTEILNELLNKVMPIVPKKASIVVLQYLFFDLHDNNLKVIATNEELSIQTIIEVDGIEDGKILVPAKKFAEIVGAFGKSGEVSFSANENNSEIQINFGKGKYKFSGIEYSEFVDIDYLFGPIQPLANEIEAGDDVLSAEFEPGEFPKISDRNLFAVSTEDYKPAMTGVLFQFRGTTLTTVSTDGFRLNRYIITKENQIYPEQFDVIIPANSMEFLKKVNSQCKMVVIKQDLAPKFLRFEYDNTLFTTRIITEKFPPYETIIPSNYQHKALVPLNELSTLIKRTSIFANTVNKLVILYFNENELSIKVQNDETGEYAEETLPCEFNSIDFEIGVRHDYFLQALQHLSYQKEEQEDIVELKFNDPIKPYIVCPKDEYDTLLMLNMPVRYK